jgi:hypothetical protein
MFIRLCMQAERPRAAPTRTATVALFAKTADMVIS